MSDHKCDTGYFDRAICHACGSMHSFCSTCGYLTDGSGCEFYETRPAPSGDKREADGQTDREALADLIDPECVHCKFVADRLLANRDAVLRALGCTEERADITVVATGQVTGTVTRLVTEWGSLTPTAALADEEGDQ